MLKHSHILTNCLKLQILASYSNLRIEQDSEFAQFSHVKIGQDLNFVMPKKVFSKSFTMIKWVSVSLLRLELSPPIVIPQSYCNVHLLRSPWLKQLKTADFENTFAPGCVVVFLNDYNIVPNKSCLFGNSIFQDRYRIFDGVFQCCHWMIFRQK